MILLILPLIWAAVLLPPWLLHVRERRDGDSVTSFDRRMAALERSSSVRYVFRSEDPYRSLSAGRRSRRRAARGNESDRSFPASHVGIAGELQGDRHDYGEVEGGGLEEDEDFDDDELEVTLVRGGESEPRGEVYDLVAAAAATSRAHPASASLAERVERIEAAERQQRLERAEERPERDGRRTVRNSRRALRRRRQIFFSLLVAFLASLGAGVASQDPAAWGVHAAVVLCFAGYMSLLVRHQHRSAERATKVRRIAPDERAPDERGRSAERPGVVVLSGRTAR